MFLNPILSSENQSELTGEIRVGALQAAPESIFYTMLVQIWFHYTSKKLLTSHKREILKGIENSINVRFLDLPSSLGPTQTLRTAQDPSQTRRPEQIPEATVQTYVRRWYNI